MKRNHWRLHTESCVDGVRQQEPSWTHKEECALNRAVPGRRRHDLHQSGSSRRSEPVRACVPSSPQRSLPRIWRLGSLDRLMGK